MKILSAGIQHETNTFSTVLTTLADFRRDSQLGDDFAGGEALRQLYAGTNTIHGGYLLGEQSGDFALEPVLCARAQPAGLVTDEAFDWLVDQVVARFRAAGSADGILLDLHGAMVTQTYDDAEAEIVRRVRAQVDSQLPVIVTLDLHANISAELAAASDMLIGYETYPHVDMEERGVEAAQLMVRIVRDGLRVHQVFRQLPLITLPPKQCTLRSPMRELIGSLRKLKSRPEILSATVAMGFPFADIPNTGVSLVVSADEAATAEAAAAELSDLVWGLRDELQPELVTIETAMQRAGANAPDAGPLIFADGSDNPGGGAPCDGTVALHALVDAGFAGAVVGVLHDPETVAQAHDAGVGATIEARIGGKSDNLHGATLVAPAYVRALNDGQFTHRGPMFHNLAGDMGRMATVVVNQVLIVVAENRRQLLDSEMLRIAGVTPEHARLIVVKSAVHFRGDFERFASEIVDADTPGIHRPDFGCFRFSKLRRPIYPLDELDEL